MNVGWLLDAEMFDSYREDLVAAIRNQGHDAVLIQTPRPPYRWEDVDCSYRKTFPADACVVTHGDIELVTRVHNDRRWKPGAFCTVEHFACTEYLSWCGKYWVNSGYIVLPFGLLEQQKDFLFDTVGIDDRIFVRPDSPLKLFTGQIVTRDTFADDLEFMGFYEFPHNSAVLISPPKTISSEWRFVVAAGKVVAGCLYKSGDEFDSQPTYDSKAFDLATLIASLGQEPDPVWIVDICKTSDNAYHLLEVGGFSFSDLYACNKADIVTAVSSVANAVWRGTYG